MRGLWTKQEFEEKASNCLTLSPSLTVTDEALLRSTFIDELIYNAVFTEDEILKKEYHTIISALSTYLLCPSSSIRKIYLAKGENALPTFTTAAFNLRVLPYDTARVIFRQMQKQQVAAVIFEIARSEMEYSEQRPREYASCILAAAIKENYQGPVFLQGDHYQFSKRRFEENQEAEIQTLNDLISESLSAGFYNIDIDASTLVDLEQESIAAQQRINGEMTALLTSFIRTKQPAGIEASVGGEIGHIGGRNSTVSDLRAFMEIFTSQVKGTGISKVSVQTGSTHGGTVLPDGKLQETKIDFSVLEEIGAVAREEYGLAGAVQHGASTLPLTLFSSFPKIKTAEIHLATAFQNMFYDSLPQDLTVEITNWLKETQEEKKEASWTEEQFLYKTRKFALGPFKNVFWEMTTDEKKPYLTKVETYITEVFEKLALTKTQDSITPLV